MAKNPSRSRVDGGQSKSAWMIDPPSGWQYGFPKRFDPEPGQSMDHWLSANGYPQDEIDNWMGRGVPCRLWKQKSLSLSCLAGLIGRGCAAHRSYAQGRNGSIRLDGAQA